MIPRWYQTEGVDSIFNYFEAGNTGNPVVAMPTGTGKSIVIAMLVKKILQSYEHSRIIKLTHVKELIAQNFNALLEHYPLAPAGIYSAGLGRRDSGYPITFAGIGSVARKADLFGHIDLALIDEAHLVGQGEKTNYQIFLAGLKRANPRLKVIGFTATPYRLGQGLITDEGIFTDICYDVTGFEAFNRLIAEGWIAPLVPKRTSAEIDISGVSIQKGDFNQRELQDVSDRAEITCAACDEMCELGRDRHHWLVFGSGIEHVEHIAEELRGRGITAVTVHSKMDDKVRDKNILDFREGRVRCAVNNVVLATGFDAPFIDMIGMLYATTSPGRWVQMLGRGTRPYPGKANCLVLDFAGNTNRLGPINDPIIPHKRGKKGGAAPVRCCPMCNTYNHISVRFCTECGFEFPREVKITQQASMLEVIAGSSPVVHVLPVDRVEYVIQNGRFGKPPILLARYHCGMRQITDFVCLEHDGYASKKARDWWRKRSLTDPPDTVDEALKRTVELQVPKHIRVWINRKYPELLSYDFTGEGFGDDPDVIPEVVAK
jgi:DNA repair protein RadD